MKNIIKLFASAITFLIPIGVYAQDDIPCPEVNLPYECWVADPSGTGGEWKTVDMEDVSAFLALDPDNEVVRWQGTPPILINYTTPDVSQHSTMNGCINQADLDQCIADDFDAWTSICPGMFVVSKVSSFPSGSSGINMGWDNMSNNFATSVFGNGNKNYAAGYVIPGSLTSGGGLKRPSIFLNNSQIYQTGDNGKGAFIFTTCPQNCTIPNGNYAVSICQVMLHEIGHTFGLDDLMNDPGGDGRDFPGAVMYGDIYAGKDGCLGDQGLQDIDVCYFCKLYCPENCEDLGAPLPQGDTSMLINVFPNPAKNSFTITYHSKESNPRIEIADMLGRTMKNIKLDNNEGSIDVERGLIPSGAYILKLEGDSHFIVKLLILE